ncbi:hypothetical protein Tco_0447685, partial [Tanacetum coccineum]
MTRYLKWWTKCSKASEPSLGEKWLLGQHKWSVLLKGTKDTFVRHGPEDLKEPEIEVDQEKHEGIWGVHSLSQERYFHPVYQDSERNPRHGKRKLPKTTVFNRNSRKAKL